MNKEEIKHFKAMLRQGSLRHMNILLDDKFQKELLNIIKDYEKLQQENEKLHIKIDKAIKRIELLGKFDGKRCTRNFKMMSADFNYLLEILKDSDVDE